MGIASECSIGMPELLAASRIMSGKAFAMMATRIGIFALDQVKYVADIKWGFRRLAVLRARGRSLSVEPES